MSEGKRASDRVGTKNESHSQMVKELLTEMAENESHCQKVKELLTEMADKLETLSKGCEGSKEKEGESTFK
ncbi:hypothetical protein [Bacillus sp. SORGH_AS_0510]|uniref:hypothetical protein n=1 Tax=Bacillus sp. SORGH_AS_0510 TaxID=3041771 RepID=UPI0027D915A6|nr:hypothetical protein [Bacillus sp. SORGH_AS_0510]